LRISSGFVRETSKSFQLKQLQAGGNSNSQRVNSANVPRTLTPFLLRSPRLSRGANHILQSKQFTPNSANWSPVRSPEFGAGNDAHSMERTCGAGFVDPSSPTWFQFSFLDLKTIFASFDLFTESGKATAMTSPALQSVHSFLPLSYQN
jgi:hypothetical protein